VTTRAEDLRRQIEQLRAELLPLEDAERARAAAALVGRAFKYGNSGGGEEGRWWTYTIVIGVEDTRARVLHFEVMPSGALRLGVESSQHWTEITLREAELVWADFAAEVGNLWAGVQRRPHTSTAGG
jgi:hypothetical protein